MQNSLGFVRKAFTVILIASAVIWILQNFSPALAMTSDSRESMLGLSWAISLTAFRTSGV